MKFKIDEESIARACAHYNLTDALFLQGYNLLTEGMTSEKKVLEICCGYGDLTAWMAQTMDAEITAIDISEGTW